MSESGRHRRLGLALLLALVVVAAYTTGLYLFFTALWPILPDWAKAIGFVLLAVFAIGSPIAALARLGRTPAEPGPGDRTIDKR